jgi:hypothetical protein
MALAPLGLGLLRPRVSEGGRRLIDSKGLVTGRLAAFHDIESDQLDEEGQRLAFNVSGEILQQDLPFLLAGLKKLEEPVEPRIIRLRRRRPEGATATLGVVSKKPNPAPHLEYTDVLVPDVQRRRECGHRQPSLLA